MKSALLMFSAALFVVVLAAVVVAAQHSYALRIDTLVVDDGGTKLSATLALPPGDGPFWRCRVRRR